MTYMVTPYLKNPCPGGHESYNFCRPFLIHHHCILSLSDLCLGVKMKIFKEIMHFHYMTYRYMDTPLQKNPCTGGHEIYNHNFGRPFLGHHYYTLSLSEPCPWVEKKIFKINRSILHCLPPNYHPLGWGSWNLHWPSSFWEEDVNGRRPTPTHSNRSPKLLRWPKMLNHPGNSYINCRKQLYHPPETVMNLPDTVMSHRRQLYHPLVYLSAY